jgi:hypothetical protein
MVGGGGNDDDDDGRGGTLGNLGSKLVKTPVTQ